MVLIGASSFPGPLTAYPDGDSRGVRGRVDPQELKRVYDMLCDFSKRTQLQAEIVVKNEHLAVEVARAHEIEAENKVRLPPSCL